MHIIEISLAYHHLKLETNYQITHSWNLAPGKFQDWIIWLNMFEHMSTKKNRKNAAKKLQLPGQALHFSPFLCPSQHLEDTPTQHLLEDMAQWRSLQLQVTTSSTAPKSLMAFLEMVLQPPSPCQLLEACFWPWDGRPPQESLEGSQAAHHLFLFQGHLLCYHPGFRDHLWDLLSHIALHVLLHHLSLCLPLRGPPLAPAGKGAGTGGGPGGSGGGGGPDGSGGRGENATASSGSGSRREYLKGIGSISCSAAPLDFPLSICASRHSWSNIAVADWPFPGPFAMLS